MGRGISALISKPTPAPQPTIETKSVIIEESSQFESVSVENVPRRRTPELPTKTEEESKPTTLLPRGRGILTSKLSKLASAKPGEEPVPVAPPVPPPERPSKSPELTKEVTKITSQLTSVKIDEIIVKPVGKKSDSGSMDRTTHSTESGTRYVSIATSSLKAADELKVEEIQRKSPVRKVGSSGVTETFSTNYVRLKCKNKGVYQYVVHYEPPCDSQFTRVKLLYQLSEVIGPVRLFDGFTLFLPILLPDRISSHDVERNGAKYKLRIQLTKILPPENVPPNVFNIIFKKIMKELKMSRIGQHYFSPSRQVDIANQGLQVWPGYTTAVHDYEDGLYLVIDVAHKVLRTQTCWQIMQDLRNSHRGNIEEFKQAVFNAICGSVVLTKYNNRTYKIDDILWNDTPMTEFQVRNGESISYVDYYK